MNIFTAAVTGLTIVIKKIGIGFKAVMTGLKPFNFIFTLQHKRTSQIDSINQNKRIYKLKNLRYIIKIIHRNYAVEFVTH